MNRLQQAIVWLRRIRHCRGFGIQSPSDFRFATEVVNETWPYYAYSKTGTDDDWLRRKLGQLCLRIANDLQPSVIIDLLGYSDYLRAGCRKAVIESSIAPGQQQPVLLLAPPTDDAATLPDACAPQSVIIVEDIGHHRRLWRQLTAHPRITVTFDLYYCGIAFLNPQRSPQQYIINF